jgi:hypothetical protein
VNDAEKRAVLVKVSKRPNTNPATAMAAMRVIAMRMTVARTSLTLAESLRLRIWVFGSGLKAALSPQLPRLHSAPKGLDARIEEESSLELELLPSKLNTRVQSIYMTAKIHDG